MVDSFRRRAPMANRISGVAVNGPASSRSVTKPGSPEPKAATPGGRKKIR